MMKCDMDYCLYNRASLCILDSIQVNALGMCAECIIISLDEDFLMAEKEKQLRELENSPWK